MRDAFGSTFMFKLIIIFIVFYVTFATIAVCYAKAFRIKNGLINHIEQKELKLDVTNRGSVKRFTDEVDAYLSSKNYDLGTVHGKALEDCNSQSDIYPDKTVIFTGNGACVVANGERYIISVYIPIVMPAKLFNGAIPVRGETRNYHNKKVLS